MTEQEVADIIDAALDAYFDLEPTEERAPPALVGVRTFQEADMLTWSEGFVIDFDDGSEFQVTVVKSK